MADPKEYQSLDDLFRKTFDGLPETPSPNGWDRPSDRVWEHVKTRIEPPRTGWSAQTLMMVSAFAVILAVGMYLFFGGTEQKDIQASVSPAIEQSVAVQPVVADQPLAETPPETNTEKPLEKSKQLRGQNQTEAKQVPVQQAPAPVNPSRVEPGRTGAALPLPGSKPDSPNTKERLKNGAWRAPFQALPILRQQPAVPAIRASLRYQFPAQEN